MHQLPEGYTSPQRELREEERARLGAWAAHEKRRGFLTLALAALVWVVVAVLPQTLLVVLGAFTTLAAAVGAYRAFERSRSLLGNDHVLEVVAEPGATLDRTLGMDLYRVEVAMPSETLLDVNGRPVLRLGQAPREPI